MIGEQAATNTLSEMARMDAPLPHMDHMPLEILDMVLARASSREAGAARHVCRKWNSLFTQSNSRYPQGVDPAPDAAGDPRRDRRRVEVRPETAARIVSLGRDSYALPLCDVIVPDTPKVRGPQGTPSSGPAH